MAGSVQFISNSANQAGAIIITFNRNLIIAHNAQVTFQGNSAHREGGAILTYSSVVLGGSVQFINNTAKFGGAIYLSTAVLLINCTLPPSTTLE